MKFIKTKISGCFEIKPKIIGDKRGFFYRALCTKELKKINLKKPIVQINTSFSSQQGTLRGMHYQKLPFSEDKIITCLKGGIFDVVLDLRKKSKTFKKWIGRRLDEKNKKMLIIPRGCAHGFLTLKKNTLVTYYVTNFYNPKKEHGVRFDDKSFKINWPQKIKNISQKDLNWDRY